MTEILKQIKYHYDSETLKRYAQLLELGNYHLIYDMLQIMESYPQNRMNKYLYNELKQYTIN